MKKPPAFFAFLLLGSMQFLSGQSLTSQFSVRSAKQQAAQASAATPSTTAKTRSSQAHPYISNPPVNPVGFVSATQIAAGGGTYWSAVAADFNNDGKMDIAAPVETSKGTYAVAVVLNNGDGSFQPAQILANPNGVYGDQILVGDANADGNQDLIVVHSTAPSTFEVWLGNGDGTFKLGNHTTYPISPNYPLAGALTTLTINGKLDLVFIDTQTPSNVWTILGNGDGSFGSANTPVTVTGGTLSDVVFADFNGDGILDFAATDAGSAGQTVVYTGSLSGSKVTFTAGTPLTNPNQADGICNNAAGILNSASGKPDLVSVNCGAGIAPGSLTVYVNNGDGTFPAGVVYSPATELTDSTNVSVGPLAVTIADVNGDGKNDIVSSNNYGGDVTVLLGNGDGTLNVPTVGYATGGSPGTSALVADFNGDGFADIVVPDKQFSFAYLQGYGDGTFRSAMDFYSPVPDNKFADGEVIASGDFNGDGYPDFVVGNCCDKQIGITVFLSNPDGSLGPGKNLTNSGDYASVVAADFFDLNHQGNLDIAAFDYSSNSVEIFRGYGDGTFKGVGNYSVGGTNGVSGITFNRMVTGDFNGDGYLDLAVITNSNQSVTSVSVLLNNGDGTFGTAAPYLDSGIGSAIATADVNGDGVLDLIVPQSNQGVDVFLGNANGTFQAAKTSTFAFNNLGNLAVHDLNGDGKPDLVVAVADKTTPNVGLAVAQGNGDGTFAAPVLYAMTTQNTSLSLPVPGDVKIVQNLKGNGLYDLVYTNLTYGTVGFLYNTGANPFAAGMFYDPIEYPAGSLAYSLVLADVNHDGAIDVVTSNNNYAGVTVLLNASGNFNTIASSVNPASATEPVVLTATVAASVRGVTAVPSGSVSFLDGSTTLGTATLSGGVAAFTANTLAVGTHSITAQYSGDSNFHSSASVLMIQTVNLASDFTALASSLNPAGAGQAVILTAALSASSSGVTGVPTGAVSFYDGANLLGTATLAKGVAQLSYSNLSVGTHNILAQYTGDANFAASSSTALSESVVAPDFNLAAKDSTATVNPGSNAEYTFNVTPTYGYSGTISLSCPASLPSKVSCSFSPASLAPSGGAYPSSTLTLSTTAATASMVMPVLPNSNPAAPTLWASLTSLGMFGLVVTGMGRKRRMAVILGLLILAMTFTMLACGGSSNSSTNNNTGTPGTPAGSYTVTVTATGTGSTAPTHTMNVTLIVQ